MLPFTPEPLRIVFRLFLLYFISFFHLAFCSVPNCLIHGHNHTMTISISSGRSKPHFRLWLVCVVLYYSFPLFFITPISSVCVFFWFLNAARGGRAACLPFFRCCTSC
ncbi:hypothetical protein AHF37_11029 [Paragonimus kellicotti]|nr:hypothetical protein AHF37_11029 [Paragonimus kellicotti]